MKTDRTVSDDRFSLATYLSEFDLGTIVNANMFYDYISEKWTLVISYYE